MVIQHDALAEIRDAHPHDVLVYGVGCFDLIHHGHTRLFKMMRSLGDYTLVGVTPDIRIREQKGEGRPVRDQDSRLEVVDAMRDVDYSFITPHAAPGYRFVGHYILKTLKPDIYVSNDPVWENDREMLENQGTQLMIVDRQAQEISTSDIVDKIQQASH